MLAKTSFLLNFFTQFPFTIISPCTLKSALNIEIGPFDADIVDVTQNQLIGVNYGYWKRDIPRYCRSDRSIRA
jgi:hypothetical protein